MEQSRTANASVYETQLAPTLIDNKLGNICQIMEGEVILLLL